LKFTNISSKSFCIIFSSLMIMGCGGGGSTVDNSRPDIILTRTAYDFAGVVINNSVDHVLGIGNNGDANLSVGRISAVSPYSIPAASDACSSRILAPLDTCTFEVRFLPTTQGTFASQVSIPSNDPDGIARINLTGEGYGLNVWLKKADALPGCVANVGVTVSDDEGNILDDQDLSPTNHFSFEVDNNAVAAQNILYETYETPSPFSVVLAIDTSGSERAVIADIRNAAISFINQLDDADEAAVCSFNNAIDFEPASNPEFHDIATHRQTLIDYIETITPASQTRLYDALYESVDRLAGSAAPANRPLIVVLSDGIDTISNRTLDQAVSHAEDNGVAVFTIYYRDPDYEGGDYGDPNILKRLSAQTGGQDYDGMTGGLDSVYYKIVGTIRNMFIFELNIPGCSQGDASLEVSVDNGNLYGKDSTTIVFP